MPIQFKSDQEPSIVALQIAIQEIRVNVIPVNSHVGESESNGRVENAIRRVQEKIRVLRHQLENNLKQEIQDNAPIMAWLIRWSAELISKYAPGDDGKNGYERIRREFCKVPVVPFGETVMYLPLKTANHSKGKPAKKLGVWLGTIERTEETLIGTPNGVIKCRTISRFAEGDRWNVEMVVNMAGVPWQPIPTKTGQHIPVEVNENGDVPDEHQEIEEPPKARAEADEEELEYYRRAHNLHISQKAINKYGATEGCPACSVINRRGHMSGGRLGYNHNTACRTRILEEMRSDPEYRRLMYKREPHQEAGELEILTEEQVAERRHNVQRAINVIEQRYKGKHTGMGQQLTHVMLKNLIMNVQVAEVYSPPRVTKMAETMGPRAGWALDLTSQDEDGRPWNFDHLEMRNRAIRKVLTDQPTLLIGSPMCTAFSQMNNVNYPKMDPYEVERRIAHGRKHLEFCTKLYDLQWRVGRYFIHEHPAGASSWNENCIQQLLRKHGVTKVTGDLCQYGLTTTKEGVTGPARKRTSFLTNSPCIARQLSTKCPNKAGWMVHQHITLESGRTRAAQVYPKELFQAMCTGLELQLHADRQDQFMMATVGETGNKTSDGLMEEARELKQQYKTVEEDLDEQLQEAWDDVSGAQLDPKAVKSARREEIEYIHKMDLYTKVPVSECYKRANKGPISVRWIDINKGDTERPNYRSRFVAREINTHKRDDLFAATPPLQAMKILLSMATSGNRGEVVMINDVSRAFFHASATREVYVQLPEEDQEEVNARFCGRLNYFMYGIRDAAQNWQTEYSQ